ncbi:MAG: hypothetical protein M3R48_08595 [Candidatus Dormibacteraeota bacterium]|nr:hypothetical protein [Candidatus Dormibacteraeota bacterium]
MNSRPVHEPPSMMDVTALVSAGVSWSTAMAMERWKAQEVLELLGASARGALHTEPLGRARGSI